LSCRTIVLGIQRVFRVSIHLLIMRRSGEKKLAEDVNLNESESKSESEDWENKAQYWGELEMET